MEFPTQAVRPAILPTPSRAIGARDIRSSLSRPRLTFAEWDQAWLLRRNADGSFADFRNRLAQAEERGYNTLRLDPLPGWLDLNAPDKWFDVPASGLPLNPWCWRDPISGPIGKWLIESIDQIHTLSSCDYTLSSWWFGATGDGPVEQRVPRNHLEAAELWVEMLTAWRSRFGFERLVYVDLANEVPYFLPDFAKGIAARWGRSWGQASPLTSEEVNELVEELNPAIATLQREFPELLFTFSIHGDLRWLEVPLNVDCLDVHFYSDQDPRWTVRTDFGSVMSQFGATMDWAADFGARCETTWKSVGPMLRARQRTIMAAFSDWSTAQGTPLTCTEGWASWLYDDHPQLSWDWMREWAEQALDDVIDLKFWGWIPHNFTQPQFSDWEDVNWHRSLNERFLKS